MIRTPNQAQRRDAFLERIGQRAESQRLFRQIAEGAGQPRHQGLKEQARLRLERER